MSRTDHHNPYWVRALHADADGARTHVRHDVHCVEFRGYRYGIGFASGPLPTRIVEVPLAEAEANGWHIYPSWSWTRHGVTYCRAAAPYGPFPCEPDRHGSRCIRILERDRDRYYVAHGPSQSDLRAYFYGPERRAVRDSLRDAAKIHRGATRLDDDLNGYVSAADDVCDALDDVDPPTRQTRRSTWAGGWWD